MRVAVFGGTRFIGRAIVEDLTASGHQVMVVHRGNWEPPDLPPVEHLHVDRFQLAERADAVAAFRPDAVLDTLAMTRRGAQAALAAVPAGARTVVLSSMDVYRAYGALLAGTVTDAIPLDEEAPVRAERYPYREQAPEYEKLDVEEEYRARGGIVLRLPMVYGEHDGQRREEFVLRRVRAGRTRIPIGSGATLYSRGYVRDVARGVRLALEATGLEGETFNLCEARTAPAALYVRQILDAAGFEAELVRVPDEALPPDLDMTASVAQHLVCDSSKARRLLGYTDTPAEEAIRRSVEWHLANPPQGEDPGFDADDAALAAAATASE